MNNSGALSHLKVLDLSRVVSGPYATMILGDFGAQIIKVEIPDIGDDSRKFGPFRHDESMYYANLNRNKSGMTLNLKTSEGQKIFLELVKQADVLVENFRPKTMEKLGLGYETLQEVNPKLIYAALSGFGQTGEFSDKPGYDIVAQAAGGLMSITGEEGRGPTRVGSPIGDILGGLNLTIGILIALSHRDKTGQGQMVDVALADSVISAIMNIFTTFHETQEIPERIGNRYAVVSPYDSFSVKDGYVIIACGNQGLFETLCQKVLNRPDLIDDQRFISNETRVVYHKDLKEIIESCFESMTMREVLTQCEKVKIPCSPINNLKDIMETSHFVLDREMFVKQIHPVIGEMLHTGSVIKLDKTKADIYRTAPTLSQDTHDILNDLGYSDEEINEFKRKKIV